MRTDASTAPQPRVFTIPPWLILLVILATMAAIIWGTLGLKTTAIYEEWQTYDAFSQGASIFDPATLATPARPLSQLSRWIAYTLAPDSFIGLNICNIALFIIQGLIVFAIVRQLWPENPVFAIAVAVLCLVLPADNSTGNNRYVGYHSSVVCFLFSIWFLIRYWRDGRVLDLVGMLAASILNLGMVESSYPLVFMAPLLLLQMEPRRRFTPRHARAVIWWAVVPAILLLNSFIVTLAGTSAYLNAALSQPAPLPDHLINFAQLIANAYKRMFFDSWRLALNQIDFQSFRTTTGLLVAVLIGVSLWLVHRRDSAHAAATSAPHLPLSVTSGKKNVPVNQYRNLLGLGLLIIGAGFALFAYFPSHGVLTERTYFLSDLGGALVIVVVLAWIGKRIGRSALIVSLGSALFIGIALQADLIDVLRAKTAAIQENYLLSQAAIQAPNLGSAELLVIFDPTHQLTNSMLFAQYPFPNPIEPAFQYFYNNPTVKVRICDVDPQFTFPSDVCTMTAQDIHWSAIGPIPEITLPVSKVIAFTYNGEAQLSLLKTWPVAGTTSYDPTHLIDTQVIASRGASLLDHFPTPMHIPLNEHPTTSVHFDNDSLIYFDDAQQPPIASYGWYGNRALSPRSTLDVWLSADRDYQIKTVISHSTLPETLKNITLTVNDQPIVLTSQTDANGILTLIGTIPRAVVARDLTNTRITFLSSPVTSPLAAGTGTDSHYLGFQVDQFSVTPVSAPSS